MSSWIIKNKRNIFLLFGTGSNSTEYRGKKSSAMSSLTLPRWFGKKSAKKSKEKKKLNQSLAEGINRHEEQERDNHLEDPEARGIVSAKSLSHLESRDQHSYQNLMFGEAGASRLCGRPPLPLPVCPPPAPLPSLDDILVAKTKLKKALSVEKLAQSRTPTPDHGGLIAQAQPLKSWEHEDQPIYCNLEPFQNDRVTPLSGKEEEQGLSAATMTAPGSSLSSASLTDDSVFLSNPSTPVDEEFPGRLLSNSGIMEQGLHPECHTLSRRASPSICGLSQSQRAKLNQSRSLARLQMEQESLRIAAAAAANKGSPLQSGRSPLRLIRRRAS